MSTTTSQLKQSIGQKAMYPELVLKMSADKDNKENIIESFASSLTDEEFNFLVHEIIEKGRILRDVVSSNLFKTVDDELGYILKKLPSLEKHKEELRINLISYRRKFGLNT